MTRRVLLMISSLRGGGSERQTLLLLQHLDRQRFQPHLYLLERCGGLLSEVPGDVPVHAFDEQPTRRSSHHPGGWLYVPGGRLRDQVRYLGQVVEQQAIDVIYDRTFHMTMIAGGLRSQRVPRLSTIVSPPEEAFPLVETRFRWLKHQRLRRAYHGSAAVIAVSEIAARSASRFYHLDPARIETIPNPVDRAQVRHLARQPAPPRDDRVTIVCVGRMTREKGHAELIDAIARLESIAAVPPLHVWLIGDGPLRGALEQRVRSRLARHEVSFLAALDNPAPAIAAADALVLPSLFEGMPNVVLEAFALGTPVIATRAGGTMELERDQPTMMGAEPGDAGSLAAAIEAFLADRAGAEARTEAASRLIERYHDVDAFARRIEDRLESVSRDHGASI